MATLELEGTLKLKLETQSGQNARGSWTKQSFILDYQDGSYPAEVCFTAFGNDKVAELDKYKEGDTIKVSFNLRAREYNGRWYNDVRVWRISPAGQTADNHSQSSFSVPQQASQQAPAPTFEDIPADNPDNDLPF